MSGGINLAITSTANLSAALTMAAVLMCSADVTAGVWRSCSAIVAALADGLGGRAWRWARHRDDSGAHPILLRSSMMIFRARLGRVSDARRRHFRHSRCVCKPRAGEILGVPAPMIVFAGAVLALACASWRARATGSPRDDRLQPRATRIFGNSRRAARSRWSTPSRGSCARLAGIVMLTRFNSVRVGHGEAYAARDRAGLLSRWRGSVRRIRPCAPVSVALLILQTCHRD